MAGVAVLAAIGVGAYVYMRSKNSADSTQLAEVQLVDPPEPCPRRSRLMPPPPTCNAAPRHPLPFCSQCGAPCRRLAAQPPRLSSGARLLRRRRQRAPIRRRGKVGSDGRGRFYKGGKGERRRTTF